MPQQSPNAKLYPNHIYYCYLWRRDVSRMKYASFNENIVGSYQLIFRRTNLDSYYKITSKLNSKLNYLAILCKSIQVFSIVHKKNKPNFFSTKLRNIFEKKNVLDWMTNRQTQYLIFSVFLFFYSATVDKLRLIPGIGQRNFSNLK